MIGQGPRPQVAGLSGFDGFLVYKRLRMTGGGWADYFSLRADNRQHRSNKNLAGHCRFASSAGGQSKVAASGPF